jgi:Protein of unknown function (DUF3631)
MSELAALLEETAAFIRRFVVSSRSVEDTCALWTAHTYVMPAVYTTPYLHIVAPGEECGKSRLGEEVLGALVKSPLVTANASPAVIFRSLGTDDPRVLIMDEIDTLFSNDSRKKSADDATGDIRALLNAGNRRGVPFMRCMPPAHTPTAFDVFSPKILIGVGDVLPRTTASRCIRIRMERKKKSEQIEPWRYPRSKNEAEPLVERWQAWAAETIAAVRGQHLSEHEFPAELGDRARDGWEPLLVLARMAGGDWWQRARRAAVYLTTSREGAGSEPWHLIVLRGARDVFAEGGMEELATTDLILRMAAMDESPFTSWVFLDAAGDVQPAKGTAAKLSRQLTHFDVKPGQLWVDGKNVRGYRWADLEDACDRYLDVAPSVHPAVLPARPARTRMVEPKTAESYPLGIENPSGYENGANPHGQTGLAGLAGKTAGLVLEAFTDAVRLGDELDYPAVHVDGVDVAAGPTGWWVFLEPRAGDTAALTEFMAAAVVPR